MTKLIHQDVMLRLLVNVAFKHCPDAGGRYQGTSLPAKSYHRPFSSLSLSSTASRPAAH